jgi:carbohydrate diacid regulator
MLAMGIALPGIDGAAISYQSAQAAARIGRARDPAARHFSYDELALPVLLSGRGTGWQARQLRQPMARLHGADRKGLLRRTLDAWFAHDGNAGATACALHVHRNTLDYRLRRIADITGLDLARTEDRFLLYVSALLETP